jgi:AcrR family transcriptional regulator
MNPILKPRKAPKQARSQATIDTILEATARILSKRGYAGTNTNLIAERAGVSIGSLYQYFPNKDSLIAALYRRHSLQMQDMIVGILSESRKATLREAVKALVKNQLETHSLDPELYRVLDVEVPLNLRENDSSVGPDFYKRVQKLLGEHRKEILRPNLELAAYIILHMVRLLVHQALLEVPPSCKLPEIENAISEAVLGYLILPVRSECD